MPLSTPGRYVMVTGIVTGGPFLRLDEPKSSSEPCWDRTSDPLLKSSRERQSLSGTGRYPQDFAHVG